MSPSTNEAACPNCGHRRINTKQQLNGVPLYLDCFNDCAERGLAPKIETGRIDKPKNKAAQDLGSLGGRAGRGDAKRRSKEHYAKMVEARAEQRRADKVRARLTKFWVENGSPAALTPKSQQNAA